MAGADLFDHYYCSSFAKKKTLVFDFDFDFDFILFFKYRDFHSCFASLLIHNNIHNYILDPEKINFSLGTYVKGFVHGKDWC